jgi:hypothetical protein
MLQVAGVSFSVASPVARGPRKEGQLVWASTFRHDRIATQMATGRKAGINLGCRIAFEFSDLTQPIGNPKIFYQSVI